MKTEKVIKNLVAMVVIAIAAAGVLAQSPPTDENRKVDSESTQRQVEVERPENMTSLREFVEIHFASKIDLGSITETFASGKPAVTFSFTEGDRTTESLLVDNGDSLSLHTDTFPSKWKVETVDQELPAEGGTREASIEANPDFLIAAAVPTCAGVASPGNPYPCCNTNKGNCTFYAWHAARHFWGYSMPTWGGNGASDAKHWHDKSRTSGLPTSTTPGLYAIAVSSTISSYGHVAFVMEIADNMVLVFEQNCGSSANGITQKWRSVSSFNKGYVLSPINAPKPTVSLATVGPIFKRNANQPVQFRVTNVNPGKRAVVIFPSGGRATLKDAQLSTVQNGILSAYMTLSTRGTYKIQIFNENGKYSELASFWVN